MECYILFVSSISITLIVLSRYCFKSPPSWALSIVILYCVPLNLIFVSLNVILFLFEAGHRHHRGGLDQSPRERFKYWLRKLITVLFSQVGVGSLLVLYTIFGAMLFISIESVVDSRRLSQVASLRSSTVIQLWNVTQNYNVIYGNEWRKEVDQIVRHFQDGLVREIRLGYEGIDAKEPWTFPQALMFSLSVYTTIGKSKREMIDFF